MSDIWLKIVAAVTGGTLQGIKLGPGVLGTIIPINLVGLLALVGVVWALNSTTWLAAVSAGVLLLFLLYLNERAFRFAKDRPLESMLSGGELFQIYRDQAAARDKSIVSDDRPIEAASPKLIDAAGDDPNA